MLIYFTFLNSDTACTPLPAQGWGLKISEKLLLGESEIFILVGDTKF